MTGVNGALTPKDAETNCFHSSSLIKSAKSQETVSRIDTTINGSTTRVNGALTPKDAKTNCFHSSSLIKRIGSQETAPRVDIAINGATNGEEFSDNQPKTTLPQLLLWSAADEAGLGNLVAAYQTHFAQTPSDRLGQESYLEALSYTLALRRTHFSWRSYAVIESESAFPNLPNIVSSPIHSGKKLGLAFIFTGQGARYRDIGNDLLSYSVFEKTLRSIDDIYRSFGCEWSLFGRFLYSTTRSPYFVSEAQHAARTYRKNRYVPAEQRLSCQ